MKNRYYKTEFNLKDNDTIYFIFDEEITPRDNVNLDDVVVLTKYKDIADKVLTALNKEK